MARLGSVWSGLIWSVICAAMDSTSIEDGAPDAARANIDIAMGMEDEDKGLGLDRSLEEMGGLLAERDEEISALRERLEELEMKIKGIQQEKKELAKVASRRPVALGRKPSREWSYFPIIIISKKDVGLSDLIPLIGEFSQSASKRETLLLERLLLREEDAARLTERLHYLETDCGGADTVKQSRLLLLDPTITTELTRLRKDAENSRKKAVAAQVGVEEGREGEMWIECTRTRP